MKRIVFLCTAVCLCPAVLTYSVIASSASSKSEHSYAKEIIESEVPASDIQVELPETNESYVEPFVLPDIFEDYEKQSQLRQLALENPDIMDLAKNASFYPEKFFDWLIADPNPKLIEFLKAYPTAAPMVAGGLTAEECYMEYPHFLQYDTRWGFAPYGETTIAKGGCGPTALSMVSVALTGNLEASPAALAKYAEENGYYVKGTGTAWSLFSSNITQYGIKGRVFLASYENIINALDNGRLIVLSLKPGEFTDLGHIIVIVGHKDGKLIIRDPGSVSRTDALWDYERLLSQIKGSWEFSKI